jgi:hypothetical protein
MDACPAGFDCVMTNDTQGVCFFASAGGGCCSASGGDGAIGALLVGYAFTRRRDRRHRARR